MSAETVADNSFSPGRQGRGAVATARSLGTGLDPRRDVAIAALTGAPGAIADHDRSISGGGGTR